LVQPNSSHSFGKAFQRVVGHSSSSQRCSKEVQVWALCRSSNPLQAH